MIEYRDEDFRIYCFSDGPNDPDVVYRVIIPLLEGIRGLSMVGVVDELDIKLKSFGGYVNSYNEEAISAGFDTLENLILYFLSVERDHRA